MRPGRSHTAQDVLRAVSRRGLLMIVPFLVISLATIAVARHLPNRYRSETLILIVPQRIPEAYVRSTVTGRIEDRLKSISQQILSRTRLERVIQDFNLYVEQRGRLPMEDVVEGMRSDIMVETVKGDAFRVAYTAEDARTAMKVTERLASMFVEENLRDREVLADGTNQFLESQLEDARRRLVEQEKKLEEYRLQHSGELPSQLQSNLQVIQTTQLQVQALLDSLSRDRDRRALLDRSIRDVEELESAPAQVRSIPAAGDVPATVGTSPAEQLELATKTLSALELRLKSEHPDVIQMKRLVNELQARVGAEASEKGSSPPSQLVSAAEVAKEKRIRAMRAELESLDRQIAFKESEERRLRHVTATYQSRVEAVPARESEMTELMRDYDTLRAMYTGLLAKKEESRIAANLERRQIGEQFKILDPARLPERPVSPNRALINSLGALFGLALGIGLVVLLEFRDSSIKTEEDIVGGLALPALAIIPVLLTSGERRKLKWRRVMLSSVATVSICVCVGLAAWLLGVLPPVSWASFASNALPGRFAWWVR